MCKTTYEIYLFKTLIMMTIIDVHMSIIYFCFVIIDISICCYNIAKFINI